MTALLCLFLKINRAFWKYGESLKSCGFCHLWKNNNKHSPSDFFLRVARTFLLELAETIFGTHCACTKEEICRFVLRSALCVRRRHETIEVSPKFVEKNITNQGTSCEKCFVSEGKHGRVCWSCACKTVSCGKETFPNIQESIMRVVAVHHH